VQNRRDELKRRSRLNLAKESSSSTLRRTDAGLYRNILDRLQIQKLLEDPKVIDKLAEAGFRGPGPVTTFYFFRFVMPFVLALMTAVYVFAIQGFGLATNHKLIVTFLAFFIGFYRAGDVRPPTWRPSDGPRWSRPFRMRSICC
jgi:tight adherence protein C